MTFSSLVFLFIFFPAFFILYYLTPERYRNYTAVAGSLFFYAWGAPIAVVYLVVFSIQDYIISLLIEKYRERRSWARLLLSFSIVVNLLLLGYFKYANFFVHELNTLAHALGLKELAWVEVALPIGISFFTFHKISYVVDVYRRTTPPAQTPSTFLLYIVLFPQLIAGPIIRYHDIAEQLHKRIHCMESFFEGMFRFSVGLGKKVLIANVLGEVADKVFACPVGTLPIAYTWFGIVCYSMQIYFDFSGYSDMAIGLARMMGFHFPENFNLPYISRSITEFWHRWHISLSAWMREYLYIPLGGNRVSSFRNYLNLWTVFLISGIWHGASWTFIIWGAYHGFFLTLDKVFWQKKVSRLHKGFGIIITYVILLFSWVIFRAPDLRYAVQYCLRMLGLGPGEPTAGTMAWEELADHRTWFVLAVALIISFLPATEAYAWINRRCATVPETARYRLKFAGLMACALLGLIALSNSNFNPFIYFRF